MKLQVDRRLGKWLFLVVLTALGLIISGCTKQNQGDSSQKTDKDGIIYYVQTSPANMLQQLGTGEIDAFVAWEPHNAQAIIEGNGRYLLQSAEIAPEHPCCILAIAGKEGNEDLALALAWANVKAIEFINDPNNREKVIQYAMDFTGKNMDSVVEAMTYTKFVNFPDLERLADFLEIMRQNGTLVKEPSTLGYGSDEEFFQDFINKKYVETVVAKLANDPSWTPPKVDGNSKIYLGYINQDLHHLPLYVAVQEGFYNEVGLISGENLQLKGYVNGVAVMEAFKVKELTASYLGVAPAVLKRLNDGILIRGIAGANDEGSAIVVAKGSDIQTVKDLQGKTVAIPGMGTVQSYILDLAARNNNLKLQAK